MGSDQTTDERAVSIRVRLPSFNVRPAPRRRTRELYAVVGCQRLLCGPRCPKALIVPLGVLLAVDPVRDQHEGCQRLWGVKPSPKMFCQSSMLPVRSLASYASLISCA